LRDVRRDDKDGKEQQHAEASDIPSDGGIHTGQHDCKGNRDLSNPYSKDVEALHDEWRDTQPCDSDDEAC